MILEYTKDAEIITKILFDESIWDRSCEDGQSQENFMLPSSDDWVWCLFKDEDVNIGAFCIHPVNNTTVKVHIHVLGQYREKQAYECGVMIISWFANSAPKNINKMIAEIPVIYPDVYHYTKKFGFSDEGLNRESHTKNGKIHDQYMLGITRSEAQTWEQRQR